MLLLYTHKILGWFKFDKLKYYQYFINQKPAENQPEKYSVSSNQVIKEISKIQKEYSLERRLML